MIFNESVSCLRIDLNSRRCERRRCDVANSSPNYLIPIPTSVILLFHRENRVTHVLIFATIGLSVLMTPLLKMIPMPVLFGVFLYMGVSALKGLQFFDRILIMFMPAKYQPDYTFLRQVRMGILWVLCIESVVCRSIKENQLSMLLKYR